MTDTKELIKEGERLYNLKDYKNALCIFEKALSLNANDSTIFRYLGQINFKLKEYKKALLFFLKDETPQSPEIKGEIGECYYYLKDFNNSQIYLIDSIIEKYNDNYAKILENALKAKPNDEALFGLKLIENENHPSDIKILREITTLGQKLKKFDIVIPFFKLLLKLSPKDHVAWNNLGLIYEEIGDWENSYECYKKALSLKDFFSPNFNLGIISRKMHKFNDSIKYLKKAVIQNPKSPQPKYSLSMSYMMLKDFKNGYPLYAKHMSVIMPSFYKNEWDGKKQTESSLCIFTTGGLGDVIMFARYFDYIKDNFKKIYILLPNSLNTIIKRNYPYLNIIDSRNYFDNFDFAITPMHILKLFNLDFNEFVPKKEGFLSADEELSEEYKQKFFNHDKLKIAINWHGNREGTRTFFNRSMPIECLEPVFEKYKDRAIFYSIQKDESYIEADKYPFIVNMYDSIKDFGDTAAILKNVDLLISIDSSPVHMAGAIGVKTYAILPYANEWRWFVDDDKTIWYDSVELFRQDTEGDWDSAVRKILLKMGSIY